MTMASMHTHQGPRHQTQEDFCDIANWHRVSRSQEITTLVCLHKDAQHTAASQSSIVQSSSFDCMIVGLLGIMLETKKDIKIT